VFLDLETTGLHPPADEVLEIGILADTGEVLLDTLVRPVRRTVWPQAQAIHGIAPTDVSGAPILADLHLQIAAAVSGARVVIYNAPFDAGFLGSALDGAAEVRCAMREFAEAFGERNAWRGGWRWQKLAVAATHVGFAWPGTAHRAIHDCAATRAVWHWLRDPRRAGVGKVLHGLPEPVSGPGRGCCGRNDGLGQDRRFGPARAAQDAMARLTRGCS
jgi:DNA polymerase-3 subunit epsilon